MVKKCIWAFKTSGFRFILGAETSFFYPPRTSFLWMQKLSWVCKEKCHTTSLAGDLSRDCPMDRALVFGIKDYRLESCQDQWQLLGEAHFHVFPRIHSIPTSEHCGQRLVILCSAHNPLPVGFEPRGLCKPLGPLGQTVLEGLVNSFNTSLKTQGMCEKDTHRGARTHDHKVKSLALCRLS